VAANEPGSAITAEQARGVDLIARRVEASPTAGEEAHAAAAHSMQLARRLHPHAFEAPEGRSIRAVVVKAQLRKPSWFQVLPRSPSSHSSPSIQGKGSGSLQSDGDAPM